MAVEITVVVVVVVIFVCDRTVVNFRISTTRLGLLDKNITVAIQLINTTLFHRDIPRSSNGVFKLLGKTCQNVHTFFVDWNSLMDVLLAPHTKLS